MRVLERPETAAAMLLAGLALLHAAIDVATSRPVRASIEAAPMRRLPAVGTSERKTLDWCLHNVAMIHDVYWASACTTEADAQDGRRTACLHSASAPDCVLAGDPPDDSPDCTLPEERARLLNAARAQAEQQCIDEALAGGRRSVAPAR
jgi:hypothetical protein